MVETDIQRRAREFRETHGITEKRNISSDHYLVDVIKEIQANAQLLADDRNEVFSQLYMGKFKNIFSDETKDFALSYVYACHPLDDIETELQEMGITTTRKVIGENGLPEKITSVKDGIETQIDRDEEIPIHFEVTPLKAVIEEWKRTRHSANRSRVKEFIELFTSPGVKELLNNRAGIPQEPGQKGRIA